MTEKNYQAPVITNFNKATYRNAYEDSDTVLNNAFSEERERHTKQATAFDDEMLDTFNAVKSKGDELWMDFISTFLPHSRDLCATGLTYRYCNLSLSRDVSVENLR